MYNVLDSGIPETHAGWRKVRFFYLKELVSGGRLMSLYAFENDVIRKLSEPRVHFALNCSARGCPLLPRAPFTARDLDEELDRETRRFFADTRNLRVDEAQRTVYMSELLDFYPEDLAATSSASLLASVRNRSRRATAWRSSNTIGPSPILAARGEALLGRHARTRLVRSEAYRPNGCPCVPPHGCCRPTACTMMGHRRLRTHEHGADHCAPTACEPRVPNNMNCKTNTL
jgi:hypothetical protein